MVSNEADSIYTMSRQNQPYVYIACSREAQSVALKQNRYFVAKVGTSNGHPKGKWHDRLSSLNYGWIDGKTGERASPPLMGVSDWEIVASATVLELPHAVDFEKALKGHFSSEDSEQWTQWSKKQFPQFKQQTGIGDVITMSPTWLQNNVVEWDKIVFNDDGSLPEAEYNYLCAICITFANMTFASLGNKLYGEGVFRRFFTHPEGNFRMNDDGPRFYPI